MGVLLKAHDPISSKLRLPSFDITPLLRTDISEKLTHRFCHTATILPFVHGYSAMTLPRVAERSPPWYPKLSPTSSESPSFNVSAKISLGAMSEVITLRFDRFWKIVPEIALYVLSSLVRLSTNVSQCNYTEHHRAVNWQKAYS